MLNTFFILFALLISQADVIHNATITKINALIFRYFTNKKLFV